METSPQSPEKETLLQVANDMLQIQSELEEFATTLQQGEHTVNEKFEQLKLEFHNQVMKLKTVTSQMSQEGKDEIHPTLDQLEILLSAKIQNNRELIPQKALILKALKTLEEKLTMKYQRMVKGDLFLHEMEKFKLKLEILRLRFVVGKFEFTDSYKNGMKEAGRQITSVIEQLKENLEIKEPSLDQKIKRVYRKIKKAIQHM